MRAHHTSMSAVVCSIPSTSYKPVTQDVIRGPGPHSEITALRLGFPLAREWRDLSSGALSCGWASVLPSRLL